MSTKLKTILADIVQGGVVIAAVIAVLLNIPGLGASIGAQNVALIVAAGGLVNAIVAALRPYAGATVSLVKSAKLSGSAPTGPRQVPGR